MKQKEKDEILAALLILSDAFTARFNEKSRSQKDIQFMEDFVEVHTRLATLVGLETLYDVLDQMKKEEAGDHAE